MPVPTKVQAFVLQFPAVLSVTAGQVLHSNFSSCLYQSSYWELSSGKQAGLQGIRVKGRDVYKVLAGAQCGASCVLSLGHTRHWMPLWSHAHSVSIRHISYSCPSLSLESPTLGSNHQPWGWWFDLLRHRHPWWLSPKDDHWAIISDWTCTELAHLASIFHT